jgi:hypothetical protein
MPQSDHGLHPLREMKIRSYFQNRAQSKSEEKDPLTEGIIDAAIEVHRCLGPGLLESIYFTHSRLVDGVKWISL